MSNIANGEGTIPESPITRIEQYLDYIAKNGGGGSSVEVEAITIEQNGTTTAPSGKAYSPITVNVSASPEYWTATQKGNNMVDGIYYELPSGADPSKIFAAGDNFTNEENSYFLAVCPYISNNSYKLWAVYADAMMGGEEAVSFTWDSASHSFKANENSFAYAQTFLPATIKLYHT